jgi:hypothetical protein
MEPKLEELIVENTGVMSIIGVLLELELEDVQLFPETDKE